MELPELPFAFETIAFSKKRKSIKRTGRNFTRKTKPELKLIDYEI
jgi:hypothetical protein